MTCNVGRSMGLQNLLEEARVLQGLGEKAHCLLMLPLHIVHSQLETPHLKFRLLCAAGKLYQLDRRFHFKHPVMIHILLVCNFYLFRAKQTLCSADKLRELAGKRACCLCRCLLSSSTSNTLSRFKFSSSSAKPPYLPNCSHQMISEKPLLELHVQHQMIHFFANYESWFSSN